MTTTEPMLDGMPEPPPAWTKPDRGVRMPAVELLHMLAAAAPHIGRDDELPMLQQLRLDAADDNLTTSASDAYTAIRETPARIKAPGDV